MSDKRSHNKLQAPMSVACSDEHAELAELADDGRGIPLTRFFECTTPVANPQGGHVGTEPSRRGQADCPHTPVRNQAEEVNNSSKLTDCRSIEDVVKRLEVCFADIEALKKKQDVLVQKHEDADSVRRGQVDCISERIFEAERHLRQAEERQDDAIEKASATFQKQSTNLMHVISQVNRNFEHLSEQIEQQKASMSGFEQSFLQLQAQVAQATRDARTAALGAESAAQDLSQLERGVQQQQQEQQALRDALLLTTPHSQFAEAEARQRGLSEQFEALRGLVYDLQAMCHGFEDVLADVQAQSAGRGHGAAAARRVLDEEAERDGFRMGFSPRSTAAAVAAATASAALDLERRLAAAAPRAEPCRCDGPAPHPGRGWLSNFPGHNDGAGAAEFQQPQQPPRLAALGHVLSAAPPQHQQQVHAANPVGCRELFQDAFLGTPWEAHAEETGAQQPLECWQGAFEWPAAAVAGRHERVPEPSAVPAPVMTAAGGPFTTL